MSLTPKLGLRLVVASLRLGERKGVFFKGLKGAVMEGKAKAHTMISGRVQGVFYRMETQRAASELSLYGWVKNKIDGTVEAVFEGEQSQVEAVLKWCRQGPPGSAVTEVEVNWEPYTGKYTTFEIRY